MIAASASDDKTVKLWDVPGRKLTVAVPGDELKTLVVRFSHDGRTVATAGYDGGIRLCEAATGRELKHLTGHTGAVRAVGFCNDDKQLLTCGEDSTVRLWDAAGGALSHHHGVGINRARFVAEALGDGFGVLQSVKDALDPQGIMNPGKVL